jgi:alkaline phosphatase D
MINKKSYFLATLILLIANVANTQAITAGPMLGHVTESTAIVWAQVNAGADVTATAIQVDVRIPGKLVSQRLAGFVKFHFSGLVPNRPTHIRLSATAKETGSTETHDLLFTTPKPPESAGTLRIAFGSCSQDSRRPYAPVFEAMNAEQPDMALFIGDNTYFVVGDGNWSTSGPIGDWNSEEQMISRHMRTRTNPYLQRLLRSVPSYAIWDDHDFGPNNSDRELESKDQALDIFKAVWANPGYGTEKTPGIYSKFRRGPADIFLMDDRYHKYVKTKTHPNVREDEAVIWGDEQLDWLLDELRRSKAPFKVIANGTQLIGQDGRGEGHFNEAPNEIAKLLDFLKKHKIGGVIILSGDRHHTEVMRLDQDGAPAIIEFTSSPMQQGQAVRPYEQKQPTQLWAMFGNSYGLVT